MSSGRGLALILRRGADLAPQRPDEIERAGDDEPGVGLSRQLETAPQRLLRIRLDLARKAERRGERLELRRRAAPARARQVSEDDCRGALAELRHKTLGVLVGGERDDRHARTG